MTAPRSRPWPPLVLLGLLAVLHALGGGALALPTEASPAGVEAWAVARDAPTTAMALLRLVALAVGWQQLAVLALGVAGRALRLPTLVRAVEAWTLPALRRAVGPAVGVGLLASSLLGATGAPAAAGPVPTTATLQLVEGGAPPPGEATLRVLEEPPAPVEPAEPPVPAAAPPVLGPWTVAPGDHLWSIAAATVAQATARPPSEHEVAAYWRELVLANGELVDADLIFPGQQITRPPVR